MLVQCLCLVYQIYHMTNIKPTKGGVGEGCPAKIILPDACYVRVNINKNAEGKYVANKFLTRQAEFCDFCS